MAIARVNCAWQNWPGAPGVSTFFFSTISQAKVDGLRAFYNALAAFFPTGLTIQVPSTGDFINEGNGTIGGTWSVGTTPTVVTGTGATNYAGNAGMCIHWLTSGIVGTRRLRGRTFLVPVVQGNFETNGSPAAAAITTLTTAATNLLTAVGTDMCVWSRPVDAHTEYDKKTGAATSIPGRVGSFSAVNAFRIPDLAVSLRSRRV